MSRNIFVKTCNIDNGQHNNVDGNLVVKRYNLKDKSFKKEDFNLISKSFFDKGVNSLLIFSYCIRVILNNIRSFTAKTKGRSDVSYTGKKPWKQKGTGRARAGSFGSPIWRGGGVCFGPQGLSRTLKVNKKMRSRAWASLISQRAYLENLFVLDGSLDSLGSKTSKLVEAVSGAVEGIAKGDKVAVLLPESSFNVALGLRNVSNVSLEFYGKLDFTNLAKCNKWLLLGRGLAELEVFTRGK